MPARNKTRLLKRFARSVVCWTATRSRDAAVLITNSLQFLHQIRAQPALAEWLRDLHVNIAIRTIVMEQYAASAGDHPFNLQYPVPYRFNTVRKNPRTIVGQRAPKSGSVRGASCREPVVKEYCFACHGFSKGVQHRG